MGRRRELRQQERSLERAAGGRRKLAKLVQHIRIEGALREAQDRLGREVDLKEGAGVGSREGVAAVGSSEPSGETQAEQRSSELEQAAPRLAPEAKENSDLEMGPRPFLSLLKRVIGPPAS